jgi:hypothetical protein
MSSRLNNQEREQFGVLQVLRTKAEARAFYNKIARVYDFLSENSEEPIRNFGLEQLQVREGERVLEIGFGTGTSLVALARMVGFKEECSALICPPPRVRFYTQTPTQSLSTEDRYGHRRWTSQPKDFFSVSRRVIASLWVSAR